MPNTHHHVSLNSSPRQSSQKNKCLHKHLLDRAVYHSPKQKQPKCPPTDEWMNESTIKWEYWLFTKRNEALIHGTTYRNLDNFLLSEKGQSPGTICWMIPCAWHIQNRQTYRQKMWLAVARAGEGVGRLEQVRAKGPGYLTWVVGMAAKLCDCTKSHWIVLCGLQK